jgi:hypothetical protein
MSLREDLARRLAEVVRPIDGIAGLSDYEDACELTRADECIRQMEWVCKQTAESCEEKPYAYHDWTITLAPDGWKPPEKG